MEQSSPWEADSCSASQEIPRFLYAVEVFNYVHKSSPLELTLSHIKKSRIWPHTCPYLKIILTVSCYLRLGLINGPFPLGFIFTNLYVYPILSTYLTAFGELYEAWTPHYEIFPILV